MRYVNEKIQKAVFMSQLHKTSTNHMFVPSGPRIMLNCGTNSSIELIELVNGEVCQIPKLCVVGFQPMEKVVHGKSWVDWSLVLPQQLNWLKVV